MNKLDRNGAISTLVFCGICFLLIGLFGGDAATPIWLVVGGGSLLAATCLHLSRPKPPDNGGDPPGKNSNR